VLGFCLGLGAAGGALLGEFLRTKTRGSEGEETEEASEEEREGQEDGDAPAGAKTKRAEKGRALRGEGWVGDGVRRGRDHGCPEARFCRWFDDTREMSVR
jgi:hypothetical protein